MTFLPFGHSSRRYTTGILDIFNRHPGGNSHGSYVLPRCRHIYNRHHIHRLNSEGDGAWDVYTFNTDLKNRLRKFAARYPELCKLKEQNKEVGCETYTVQKSRVSIHLNSPQSEARRKAASEKAKNSPLLAERKGLKI